jgi:hypothetical protein
MRAQQRIEPGTHLSFHSLLLRRLGRCPQPRVLAGAQCTFDSEDWWRSLARYSEGPKCLETNTRERARNPRTVNASINRFQLTLRRAFTIPLYRARIPIGTRYRNTPWWWRNIPAYSATTVYDPQGYLSNFNPRARRAFDPNVAWSSALSSPKITDLLPTDRRRFCAHCLRFPASPLFGASYPSSNTGRRMGAYFSGSSALGQFSNTCFTKLNFIGVNFSPNLRPLLYKDFMAKALSIAIESWRFFTSKSSKGRRARLNPQYRDLRLRGRLRARGGVVQSCEASGSGR